MRFLTGHRHRPDQEQALDYTSLQWCRCGRYRAKATLVTGANWSTWRYKPEWMKGPPA